MGVEFNIIIYLDIYEKIEKIIKKKSDSYIEQIVNELASYLMSEKYLIYRHSIKKEKDIAQFYSYFVAACELHERFLFIKCLFPLLERLKILKFETQLIKLKSYNPEDKDLYKDLQEELQQRLFNSEKIEKSKKIFSLCENDKIITYLSNIFVSSISALFGKKDSFKKEFCDNLSKFLKDYKYKIPIKNLLEYYYKLDSLNHVQDLYQLFIFTFNFCLYPEGKIKKFDNKSDTENLFLNTNFNENMIFIFDKNLCISPLIIKRNETKIAINLFDLIDNNKDDKSINIFICKNIFTEEEIIIIKINEEKLKEEKITFEEMKNLINNKINKTKKIYVHFKDKFVEFNESNDSCLKEIFSPFLIEEEKKIIENNSKIKLIDETKINNEMNELKEKINELKKELKKEKDKNKLLEKQIINLKNELNEEIKKNKDVKENVEIKNMNLNKLNKESKESLYKMIFEKENEIKILKTKLSRFPFELNE